MVLSAHVEYSSDPFALCLEGPPQFPITAKSWYGAGSYPVSTPTCLPTPTKQESLRHRCRRISQPQQRATIGQEETSDKSGVNLAYLS